MHTTVLVSAITVLLHAVSAQKFFGMLCSSNDGCPTGSKCVDRMCVDCTCDPMNCMRNVEVCKDCKEDEGCYLKQEADFGKNTVTVSPVCAPRNPCPPNKCGDNEMCVPVFCGLQPPTSRCIPNQFLNPCSEKTCPDSYWCTVNAAYCSGVPCNAEAVCLNLSACSDCTVSQFCDTMRKDNDKSDPPLFVGKCVDFNKTGHGWPSIPSVRATSLN